ncbi:MAG: pyridoxamine 5'-phosphate oxidase family protein [Paludibacteraceae bacterium]|nr:pyridoxamine 5'-phosphate oxidase family protein [Paludibacteraceae bacterium]MBR6042943.1 pyridoxamine 5'-phosphate oxidase family protein [Paludibacteraceae bacterium]
MKKLFFYSLMAATLCSCSNTTNTPPTNEQPQTEASRGGKSTAPSASEYQSSNQEGQQKVYDFLKATKTYYLATVDGDQPRVRPFGTVNIFEGKLYIQTGHKKNVAKQIAANPKVELCAFNGKEWIRVAATLAEDTRIEAKKSMLDAYPELRGMYNENDDNTAVFFLTEAEAKISSFGAPEEVIKF